MLLPNSKQDGAETECHGLPFGRGHFPGALGRLLFNIVLGELGDLVGERFDFGGDRQRDLAGEADGFFIQLRNTRRGVGAARGRDRFTAHSRDLLGAFRIICRPRLELLDAGAILGGLGQFEHLIGKLVQRRQPVRQIIFGLLQIRRVVGEAQVTNADLHAAYRRLGFRRIPRDRLLPGHARVEIAHRRVGPDLDDHHGGDEQNAEARGDAELGADGKIQKKTGEARHGSRP